MAKKIFVSLAIIMLSLCCVVCFAAEDNSNNVNLGGEITNSLDKAGNSMRNVADDVMDGMGIRDDNRNDNYDNNNRNNNYMDNRTGYNAVRTSVDDMTTGNMSTTTWVWIILAVAAIVIVAMIWYYAVQGNDRD